MGQAIGGTLSGLGSSVAGFVGDPLGRGAIDSGMNAQSGAAGRAEGVYRQEYDQQRQDLMPWSTAGNKALSDMGNADFQRDFTMADYQKDPGYDFRMQEGQKALERSAAARGGLQSGAFGKALSRYGQDYASNEYGNAYNRFNSDRDRRYGRLSTIAGYGQNAVNGLVNSSTNYANNMAGNYTGLGNAMAAGNIAKANANQQLLGSLIKGGSTMAGGGK